MFKNTAGTFLVYAFDSATGLPKSGDAANLTAYVKIDAGSLTVLADTSATEIDATNAKGYYLFDAAQAETNGDRLVISGKSSTSGIVVIGAPAVIFTRPQTGWLAPATAGRTLVVDASGLADANMVKMGPTGSGTAQTARDIGTSVLLSSGTGTGQLDFTSGVVKSNVTQLLGTAWLVPTTAGTPDVNVHMWQNQSAPSLTVDGLLRCDTIEILGQSPTTSIADAVWNDLLAGHVTAATFGYAVNTLYTNTATVAAIADAVWDEAISGHLTSGSTGAKLNTAGSASDPLENAVPGTYPGGTAGYALGQLGAGSITFTGPVISDENTFEVIQGDDYLIVDSRSFNFTFGASPNLTSSTVVMRIQTPTITEITGTKSGEGTSAQVVKFEMTKTQTAAFQVKNYAYDIQATLSDTSVVTLARSTFLVRSQVT